MLGITGIAIVLFIGLLLYFLYRTMDNQQYTFTISKNGNAEIKNGTNMKPPLFVYVPDETGVNKVLDFYGREKNTKDIGLLRWCLNSIILHNNSAFTIALVHSDNLQYYLPETSIRKSNTGEINRKFIATSLLHKYGGVFMPIHTLCFKPLAGIYNQSISYDLTVFSTQPADEQIADIQLSYVMFGNKNSKTLYELTTYLDGRVNGLGGGHSFDERLKQLLLQPKVLILPSTVSASFDMKARPITSENYRLIIKTKLPKKEHVHFHVLALDSFRRDEFLLKLNINEILESKMWISDLLLEANQMELKGEKSNKLPLSGLYQQPNLSVYL